MTPLDLSLFLPGDIALRADGSEHVFIGVNPNDKKYPCVFCTRDGRVLSYAYNGMYILELGSINDLIRKKPEKRKIEFYVNQENKMTNKCTDNLTLGEIKELITLFGNKSTDGGHPYKIGECYLIRTVTMIQVGRLEYVGDKELKLSSASWIADTGRFYEALKSGKLNEVEPFPDEVIVGRGSICDACIWTHKLPREVK